MRLYRGGITCGIPIHVGTCGPAGIREAAGPRLQPHGITAGPSLYARTRGIAAGMRPVAGPRLHTGARFGIAAVACQTARMPFHAAATCGFAARSPGAAGMRLHAVARRDIAAGTRHGKGTGMRESGIYQSPRKIGRD